ncbi:unannotated protein [freshwater metagenome]|uniref:Unannotated protein n=1 Tax=freshwater metagenome TaxID=449393 RepID=A0A6J7DNL8_9ZZZZ
MQRHVLDEVDAPVGMAFERAVVDEVDDVPDALLVLGHAARVERPLDERLHAVVARRVGADQHVLRHVHRVRDLRIPGELVHQQDRALRGERLEVAADGGDVLVAHDRPEAALMLEVGKLAEVQRLAAQLREELVRRAVAPEVQVAEIDVRRGAHGATLPEKARP